MRKINAGPIDLTLDKTENKEKQKISCIKVPKDNLTYLLLGYSDGKLEIRDTETLEHIFFTHMFRREEIISFQFHLDQFAHLVVTHKSKSVYSIILKPNVEKQTFSEVDQITDDEKEEEDQNNKSVVLDKSILDKSIITDHDASPTPAY